MEDLRTVKQLDEDILELLLEKCKNESYEHCRDTYNDLKIKHDKGIKISEEYKRQELLWCYNYLVKIFSITG